MSRQKLPSGVREEREKARRRANQARRLADHRELTALKKAAGLSLLGFGNPPKGDLMARLAEIPSDTRGLTARTFGDPLPGRSALDRRSA
jgi:hypothetical protein